MEADSMKKTKAIYVRRSVSDKDKGNNSLSIDSQIADCIKSLKEGENYELYCDDGKSAKDIDHRPDFQRMMSDAEQGFISHIIIKKYDRFSRDILDALTVIRDLEKIGVGVRSLVEDLDTSTIQGKAMLNIVLTFADMERKTIAARVADAYVTRSVETGFYQGGKRYYGYNPERRTVNGKTGSVLVASDKADVIRTAYRLYQQPDVSLLDIVNYFRENGIDVNQTTNRAGTKKSNLGRDSYSKFLKSPLYVRANKEVYQHLVDRGFEIVDDVEAFDGTHGLFRHKRADGKEYIKVGYHEGLVDSETWLAVQDKKSHNKKIPNNGKVNKSWLVGLAKCPYCGYALCIQYSWNAEHTVIWRYFRDGGAYRSEGCVKKFLKTKPDKVEEIVRNAMKARLDSLVIAKNEKPAPDTESEILKADIIRIDDEIRELMEKLAKSNQVLFEYINNRVSELHEKKSELSDKLRSRQRRQKTVNAEPLIDPMSRWETLTTDERHALAVLMIEVVYISDESSVDIHFSI
jgi:DNA invertase Pin-like site-specific DNA recombinase